MCKIRVVVIPSTGRRRNEETMTTTGKHDSRIDTIISRTITVTNTGDNGIQMNTSKNKVLNRKR